MNQRLCVVADSGLSEQGLARHAGNMLIREQARPGDNHLEALAWPATPASPAPRSVMGLRNGPGFSASLPSVGHDVGMPHETQPSGTVLSFADVAHLLDVPIDDAHFLHHLGVLKARNVWALSAPTFDQTAVQRCREWLQEQALEPGPLIARLRAERGADLIDPDDLVPPDRLGLAWNSYGPHYWQEAVGSGLGQELDEVRKASAMEALEDVALLPPEWRDPTNVFVTPDLLVHVAVFIGDAAAVWGVERTLDRLGAVLGRTEKRNSRYWRKQVAQAFWFVVSIWHGHDSFWAVIAFDVSPEHAAEYALIQPAYEQILRVWRRGRKKGRGTAAKGASGSPADAGAGDKEAIVTIVRDGRLSPKCRRFMNMDQALRGLGRVTVVSTGGPLEALWTAAHPRSSSGVRVCQRLQSRPGRFVQPGQLSLEGKASTSTVREVLRELSAMGAPLRHEPARGWMYTP